jgi:hypothetical protein
MSADRISITYFVHNADTFKLEKNQCLSLEVDKEAVRLHVFVINPSSLTRETVADQYQEEKTDKDSNISSE